MNSLPFVLLVLLGIGANAGSYETTSINLMFRLLCDNKPLGNAMVELWDKDSTNGGNDYLGHVVSDAWGGVHIDGMQRESNRLNAYLQVFHNCSTAPNYNNKEMCNIVNLGTSYSKDGEWTEIYHYDDVNIETYTNLCINVCATC